MPTARISYISGTEAGVRTAGRPEKDGIDHGAREVVEERVKGSSLDVSKLRERKILGEVVERLGFW